MPSQAIWSASTCFWLEVTPACAASSWFQACETTWTARRRAVSTAILWVLSSSSAWRMREEFSPPVNKGCVTTAEAATLC